MLMQSTAELTAVKCQFSDEKCCNIFPNFCSKLRLWVEVKTAISEGTNGYTKEQKKKNKNSVSTINLSFFK